MKKLLFPVFIGLLSNSYTFAANSADYEDKALFAEALQSCENFAKEDEIPTEDLESYLDSCVADEYNYLTGASDDDTQQDEDMTEE